MKNKYLYVFWILLTVIGCKDDVPLPDNPLAYVLKSKNQKIKRVLDSIDKYEVQIRFTSIFRRNDSIILEDHDFQVNSENYFYPASTVKFPLAILALEKLNENDSLTMDTRFFVEGDTITTTFAEEINKIFAVSDNEAYNRLFEFLGTNEINLRLANKGISPVRISHRLSTENADRTTTKPLVVYLNDSTLTNRRKSYNKAPERLSLNGVKKGRGYYNEEELILEPFDFSLKNYYTIEAQHAVLKRIIFPELFSRKEQFRISNEQRQRLLKAMSTVPRQAGYNATKFYDSYGKFFIYGDTKEPIPKTVKIYNKVGYAYGTLTDCAYIKDTVNNIEFLITATILVNSNETFNDDQYEYETIGIPFLAELGRELYQLQLSIKNGTFGTSTP
ncbi:serine hydrolase [Sediminicola arcticus]|uniref:Serine hydrolase n=1 Tax=Sediminicola arcticus TaxID=1574308 RepID=A0ABV2SXA2_9FLAO